MPAGISTHIIQVTNVAPAATIEQMKELFGYVGKIKEIKLYPTENYLFEPQSKVCYVQYSETWSVGVAQHLTNTVFIDRALIIVPLTGDSMPSEATALALTNPASALPGLVSSGPNSLVNEITGVDGNLVIMSTDPKLTALGLPQYPPLPATMDPAKIEEIRRTVYIGNLDSQIGADHLLQFANKIGEVKYLRMAGDESQPTRFAFVEFSDQSSVVKALQHNGVLFENRPLKINHSNNAIVKPQPKSNEAAQKEIDEAMKRVREAQSLITAVIEPELADKDKKKSRRRSRSRSRSHRRSSSRSRRKRRSHSRSRRSRSRRRSGSRVRSRSKRHSRSPSKRSKRDRSKSPSKKSRRDKSRSPSKRSKPEKSRSRSRDRTKKRHRSKSCSRTVSPSKSKSRKSTSAKESKSENNKSHKKTSPEIKSDEKPMSTVEYGPPELPVEGPSVLQPSNDFCSEATLNEDADQNLSNGQCLNLSEVNAADEGDSDMILAPNSASVSILSTDASQSSPAIQQTSLPSESPIEKKKSRSRSLSKGLSRSPSKRKSRSSSKRRSRSRSRKHSRSPSKSSRRKSTHSPTLKSRRSRTPTRRHGSRSRTRSSAYGRRASRSPRRRSRSPRRKSPRRRSHSRRHSVTPKRRSRSPKKLSSSPRRRSRSPGYRKKSRSPRRSKSPGRVRSHRSPVGRSRSSKRHSNSMSPSDPRSKKNREKDEDSLEMDKDGRKKKPDSENASKDSKVVRNYDEEEKGYDSNTEKETSDNVENIPDSLTDYMGYFNME